MKSRLITVIFVLLLFLAGQTGAFTVKTTPDGALVQWPDEETAVFYGVSSIGQGSRPGTVGALARAFGNWEKNSRGNIRFIFCGQNRDVKARKDGTNTLLWLENAWDYDPEIVAMTTIWYSEKAGLIEEADIEFNARDYRWSVNGSGEVLDIQAIALHEIGHLLGIDHSFNPGAVMHDSVTTTRPVKKALSRDDLEALSFLYPAPEYKFVAFDLPALFYPEDFPGGGSSGIFPRPEYPAFGGLTIFGSTDTEGGSSPSALIGVCVDERGEYFLETRRFPSSPDGEFTLLGPPRPLGGKGNVTGIAGVDLDRNGELGEVAVLTRSGTGETIFFYDAVPDPLPGYDHLASCVLSAPPANNVLGMTALDADGDGIKNELAVLRAARGGFSLHLYRAPLLWENPRHPQAGIELRLPGFQEGSILLGLAALDTEGNGTEENLVFLEKTISGELWLHAFRLAGGEGEAAPDLRYLTSAAVPEAEGKILPLRMTGVDLNRDGFLNELIIFSSGK